MTVVHNIISKTKETCMEYNRRHIFLEQALFEENVFCFFVCRNFLTIFQNLFENFPHLISYPKDIQCIKRSKIVSIRTESGVIEWQSPQRQQPFLAFEQNIHENNV